MYRLRAHPDADPLCEKLPARPLQHGQVPALPQHPHFRLDHLLDGVRPVPFVHVMCCFGGISYVSKLSPHGDVWDCFGWYVVAPL